VIGLTYWNGSSFFLPSTTCWEALRLSLTLGQAPGVLWTIPVELTFYLYLPIVLALALPATRAHLGGAALGLAYLAWCVAIALARHEGAPATAWMTLGFHHYANSFVGGVLLYALIANGRVRFPPSAAWVAAIAPLAFVLAMPFCRFAFLRRDPWMAELAAPGAWQSYYDAIFPFAPLIVGGIVYGLLHPSESLLSRVMRVGLLRKTGELSFGVYLVHVPMIVLIGSRYGFGPLQFFLGRQIVTWGESIFGYRVGDQINPRDTSWNFGFANPEQSYMPLWMVHPILNLPSVGPFSSNFAELVYIPGFDFMYTQVDYSNDSVDGQDDLAGRVGIGAASPGGRFAGQLDCRTLFAPGPAAFGLNHSLIPAAGVNGSCGTGPPIAEFQTGTGFPGDFYINYHLYRLVFPVSALGRYLGGAQ